MTFRIASLACASLCIAASVARAEPPIGSRVGERLEKNKVNDERDASQAAHQLAGCILAKRGSAGADLLNARTEDEVKQLGARIAGEYECIANLPGNDFVEGIRVRYPLDVMRGDIAEELLKRNHAAMAQLQPLPIQKAYSRSWFPFTGRDTSVDEMATCVAETNPAAIMALLESEPFSEGESSAFSNLIAYMGPCLRAGTKLEGKPEPLRAALAEALYQRMKNPAESFAEAVTKSAQAKSK